jgi:glycosyltransferase involved in cell wall biosynthesis
MARVKRMLRRKYLGHARIVYDAEAIFSTREIYRLRVAGLNVLDQDITKMKNQELDLIAGTDAVLAVSPQEAMQFRLHRPDTHGPVFVLPHATEIQTNPPGFDSRHGFLFVGALHDEASPNADSIRWFLREIFPLVRESLPQATIRIIGTHHAQFQFSGEGVEHIGRAENLRPYYDQARVFVAPTRFSSGVPLKIYDAASAGVPTVSTTLLANQLSWKPDAELLVADTPPQFADACIRLHQNADLWRRLQRNSLVRVAEDCSRELFKRTLQAALAKTPTTDAS